MARTQTYKTRAIVLKKTRLSEKDLVVTMVTETGELLRAVAKGARKPGSSFAARLELFNDVALMAAKGRSLDVVTDVRLDGGGVRTFLGLEHAACASAVAELLATVCQEGLEQPRLYDMAKAAFETLPTLAPSDALALAAAALLKIASSAGFRPMLDHCQSCGAPIPESADSPATLFSVAGGGATCASCARQTEGSYVRSTALAWAQALLYARFDDIAGLGVPVSASFDVLEIARRWLEHYTGRRQKSIDFLFSCGYFA